MRQRISFSLLLILIFSSCQTQPPTVEALPTETIEAPTPEIPLSGWNNRDAFRVGLIPSQQQILEELPDATTYHIDLEIDADLVHITGHQEVRYTNQEDLALPEVDFHLMPNYLGKEMLITQVSIDDQIADFETIIQDTALRVPLSPPLQPGESIVIRIDFTVTVPTKLEMNYGILASTEGVIALAHAYPMVAVYDDEGWNTAIPSEQGDVTYLDASFYIVRVTAPKPLVLVASGSEIARETNDERQVVTFAAGPARDFYLAASENYTLISKDFGDYTINSYAPAAMAEGAQMALDIAAASIELFSQSYAPYPYTEFDIVSIPTLALGIEYPGMTAINIDLYDLSDNFGNTYLEGTVVHEVGHQWFYNLVGNDQLDEPWLDESLVQYITWQYFTDTYGSSGDTGFAQSLDGRWGRVDHKKIPVGLPVGAYSDAEYSAIVYGRGAFFFEALAREMGSETFDIFLADYTQSQQWDVATSESLREMAENYCDCDLGLLFEEWIYPLE